MSDFKPFLDRCCGRWTSRRRYLFGKHRVPKEYITDFSIEETGENQYCIAWSGETSGEMHLGLEGNTLSRSRSYYNADDDTTRQTMTHIDEDTVVFHTSYDGVRYREEIRFLGDDLRLRQTVGWDIESGEVKLIGQYAEERVV